MAPNSAPQTYLIRKIKPKDDSALADLIRKTFAELGAPVTGTVLEDEFIEHLSGEYRKPKSRYFVVEENGKVLGGAGIAPLVGDTGSRCELQKMYLAPQLRGRGIGSELMRICLDFARETGFSACYLETLPFMKAAQKLYKKHGFTKIDERLGKTGHHACHLWMLKKL